MAPRRKAAPSAPSSSLASSPEPGDADSIAPEDSASQVPSSVSGVSSHRRGKAPVRRNYDNDDLTDNNLCDEENELRGHPFLFQHNNPHHFLPGRARRVYHAAFYKQYKKPVLERNKDGEIVYVNVQGASVPVYLFECLQCVLFFL